MKVAANPLATDVVAGVMAILVSAGAIARLALLEVMPPDEALTVVLPAATPVATPAALIVANALLADVHATLLVIFAVLASV